MALILYLSDRAQHPRATSLNVLSSSLHLRVIPATGVFSGLGFPNSTVYVQKIHLKLISVFISTNQPLEDSDCDAGYGRVCAVDVALLLIRDGVLQARVAYVLVFRHSVI